MDYKVNNFYSSFNSFQTLSNNIAKEHGFYDLERQVALKMTEKDFSSDEIQAVSLAFEAQKLMLSVSELSEALEALRHGNPPSISITSFSNVEEELADCVIRLMDVAQAKGYKLCEAIVAKMEYNINRPYRHEKEF